MDPTTTLITFLLEAAPFALSVSLVGSWDNFRKRYPMERDERRGRDQWRGCYAFSDIICDGGSSRVMKRQGGLKMGQTYWYYYELDDGTEFCDKTIPATTSCPFLPGQPLNLLYVPVEVYPRRDRSASVGTLPIVGLKTLNPKDRFINPRQPPPAPKSKVRLSTSPSFRSTALETFAEFHGLKRISSLWSRRSFFGALKTSQPSNSRYFPKRRKSTLRRDQERPCETRYSSPSSTTNENPAAATLIRPILSKDALREISSPGAPTSTRSGYPISFRSHNSSIWSPTEGCEAVTPTRDYAESPSRPFAAQMTTVHEPRPDSIKRDSVSGKRGLSCYDDISMEEDEDDDDTNFAQMVDLEESSKTTTLFPSHYMSPSSTSVSAKQKPSENPLPLIPSRGLSQASSRGTPNELQLQRLSESQLSEGCNSTLPGSLTNSECSSIAETPGIETPIMPNLFEEAFKLPTTRSGADRRDTFGGRPVDFSHPLLAENGYLGTIIA